MEDIERANGIRPKIAIGRRANQKSRNLLRREDDDISSNLPLGKIQRTPQDAPVRCNVSI